MLPKRTILDGRDLTALAQRFWLRIEKTATCWNWTGPKVSGYGIVYVKPSPTESPKTPNMVAHRIAYELTVGAIPPTLTLDHLCRNRACVNPDHLEPVEFAVNVRRGVSFAAKHAAKTQCPRGHPLDIFNTYKYPPIGRRSPRRECRICRRVNAHKHYLARKLTRKTEVNYYP